MKKYLSISLFIVALSVVAYTQSTGTPSTLRVRVDSAGSLMATNGVQVPPYTTTTFDNARLRTDADGNLIVGIEGSTVTFPLEAPAEACNAVPYTFEGDTNTGFATAGDDIARICAGGASYLTAGSGAVIVNVAPLLMQQDNGSIQFGQSFDGIIRRDNTLGSPNLTFQINGSNLMRLTTGMQLLDSGAKPTCNSTNRGMLWYDAGGAGVADTMEVCRKDAADNYAWVSLM